MINSAKRGIQICGSGLIAGLMMLVLLSLLAGHKDTAQAASKLSMNTHLRSAGPADPNSLPMKSSSSICTVIIAADSGPGTLRWCMGRAQISDTILFDAIVFPPGAPVTITLVAALPSIITDGLTIDASNAGVVLDGSQLSGSEDGLLIDGADYMTIRGLQVIGFPGDGIALINGVSQATIGGDRGVGTGPLGQGNLISGNKGDGISLKNGGTTDNTIVGNFIGTDLSGTAAYSNTHKGIYLGPWTSKSWVENNLISSNGEHGIEIHTDDCISNTIKANLIGTDISGTQPLGNRYRGIYLRDHPVGNLIEDNVISGNRDSGIYLGGRNNIIRSNRIGTDQSGEVVIGNSQYGIRLTGSLNRIVGNLISGNGDLGIFMVGTSTVSNTVSENYIGTTITGAQPLGNARHGIYVQGVQAQNAIESNLISGNGEDGIFLGGDVSNIAVRGNLIGTDSSGTFAVGNVRNGISLQNTDGALIGGDYSRDGELIPGQGNLISGNGESGIVINAYGDSDCLDNTIQGNSIGTNITGTSAIANGHSGVRISDGAQRSTVGPGNAIVFNACGVSVRNTDTVSNTITQNSIHGNGSGGICLSDGSNGGIASPVISTGTVTLVGGTAPPSATIEVFSDEGDQGRHYEGSVTSDGTGQWVLTKTSGLKGSSLTATATDAEGNTSEFSSPFFIGFQVVAFAPQSNAHAVSPMTAVSITYNQHIDASTVSTRTFAVHGMQTGRLTETYAVIGNHIGLTPPRPFKPGELVHVSATTGTLSLNGAEPISSTVWQFRMAVERGDGVFDSSQDLASYGDADDAEIGDLDGDGHLDVLIGSNEACEVWLNDDYGSFPTRTHSFDTRCNTALGDLDGDGDLDAFVARNSGQANHVWLNDGTGVFSDTGQALGAATSSSAALGDLDGDGDLDAYVANYYSQPNQVWLNDGSGHFTPGDSTGNGSSNDVALGDVDGDGDLDAVVVSTNVSNTVWLNDGSGGFDNSGQDLGSFHSLAVVLGDLNGDGSLDAVIGNSGPNYVYLNDGNGQFGFSRAVDDDGQGLALGDVNADGHLDVFVGSQNANRVWLNDGTGIFSDNGQLLRNLDSEGVALGDLDGDGDLDALVANRSGGSKVWLDHHLVYLPLVLDDYVTYYEGPDEGEDNDTPSSAKGPLRPGQDYNGKPDDTNDYFTIYVPDGGTITIDLINHRGKGVQLLLYYQVVDGQPECRDYIPDGFNYHVECTGPAGWYYIRIYTESGHRNDVEYTLRVTYP